MTLVPKSIATNGVDRAQVLANHFETVFTRESSFPETVLQSRTDVAKIEYVQITCSDVRKIIKSLKKQIPGPEWHSTNPFERTGGRDEIPPYENF